MVNNLLLWFQKLCNQSSDAYVFLTSTPFEQIPGLESFTPLELIGITGLVVLIGVAIVKWVIS